jgi:hypothetical protein
VLLALLTHQYSSGSVMVKDEHTCGRVSQTQASLEQCREVQGRDDDEGFEGADRIIGISGLCESY